MKHGHWIPLDKNLVYFLPSDRPYTILEAMFSYAKDLDENNENSINGYARIWSWSRCKVRRFITDLKTAARHVSDRDKTGARQEIRIISSNLQDPKDTGKTGTRQGQDSGKTTTINPNPKPNPEPLNPIAIPHWINQQIWEHFVQNRQKMKAPLTDRASKLIFDKLAGFMEQGMDINEILAESIMNNWKGVFPLKKNVAGQLKGFEQQRMEKNLRDGLEWANEGIGEDYANVRIR